MAQLLLLILLITMIAGGTLGALLGFKWENAKVFKRSRYFLGICGILLIIFVFAPVTRVTGAPRVIMLIVAAIMIIKAVYVLWGESLALIFHHSLKKEGK